MGTRLGAQVLAELLHNLLQVIFIGQDPDEYALNHLVQLHCHRLQVNPACLACHRALVGFLERERTQEGRAAGVTAGGRWGSSDHFGQFLLVWVPGHLALA